MRAGRSEADGSLIVGNVVIPAAEIRFRAVRASGPGGQNVNKVASKVELRFAFEHCVALPVVAKTRIREQASRLDADGCLLITSQLTRNQLVNLEDARQKLAAIVRAALVVPKRRHKTRPSRAARAARVDDKRAQSQKKQSRRAVYD
ncbi:MAG TPA: alternative ribosome rescue aminoacyl-tRNA hydrolase ArfB [Polyangiaceae bacterium]|jgi:ribosome-associated protein